jgi:hypothetical protein
MKICQWLSEKIAEIYSCTEIGFAINIYTAAEFTNLLVEFAAKA